MHEETRIIYESKKSLSELIVLPQGVRGYLDWITGIIRINYTQEGYELISKYQRGTWEKFFETIIHEMFHLLQICNSGYLYNYIMSIAYELLITELDIENNFLDKKYILNYRPTQKFIEQVDIINRKGKEDISVLDIVEGAAFYSHKIMFDKKYLDIKNYCSILKLYEGSVYDIAYLYLEDQIGDYAFKLFPAIAYLSLKFENPVSIYVESCQMIKKNIKEIKDKCLVEIIAKVQRHILLEHKDFRLIEDPLKIVKNDHYYLHPCYSPVLQQISTYDLDTIAHYMCYPSTIDDTFFFNLKSPVLLNDAKMVLPKSFDKWIFDKAKYHEDLLSKIAIASFKVMNEAVVGPHFYYTD